MLTNQPERRRDPLVPLARSLRATSTAAEAVLWQLLRSRQLASAKFRRQRPFGRFILDFYCISARLAIEADGGQHFTPEGREADSLRTEYLERHGVRVLRFSNREILVESDAVIERIGRALTEQ